MCSNESTSPSKTGLQYHQTSIATPSSRTSSPLTTTSPISFEHSSIQSPQTNQNQQQNGGAMSMLSSVPPSLLHLDHYRLQLYNYAMVERLRCSQYPGPMPMCPTYPNVGPYGPRLALQMSLFHNRVFQPEEPKPQHSYIGLIAMAILSSPDCKLVLSDIYQYILDNYPYFRSRGPGWRNSIRHNLSLNDCFIKSGRSANGKGHYWAIHPANIDDFRKGDFRRRKAQRKVRKHMGLAVDDEGTDSPSPPPLPVSPQPPSLTTLWPVSALQTQNPSIYSTTSLQSSRKRQFDVASLLAPDDEIILRGPSAKRLITTSPNDLDEDIDVVASDHDDNKDFLQSSNNQHHSPNSHHHHHEDDNLNIQTTNQQMTQWQGLMQQWPSNFSSFSSGMDPRILGRYYGQYMAAAQACRRLNSGVVPNNELNEIPPADC